MRENDLDHRSAPLVTIINRFYPPDTAPTGTAVQALAMALTAELPTMACVTVLTTHANYGHANYGRTPGTTPAGRLPVVERLASLNSARWPPLRLLTTLIEGRALARRAAAITGPGVNNVLVTLTDPPLLPLWLAAVAGNRRRVEWTMDLYPEALAAAGRLSPRSPLYRLLERGRRAALPDAVLCLGPGQLDFFRARTGFSGPGFILPAGVIGPGAQIPPCPPPEPLLVYAGNLGEMHRSQVVAELIERGARRGCRVLLAVHGRHAPALRRRLAPLLTGPNPTVLWRNRLSDSEMATATAHLVTLAGPATHVCVPSKAVTAVCLGRPIIFAGSPDSDVWTVLGRAGWLIAEQNDGGYCAAEIEAALDGVLDPAAVAARAAAATELGDRLREQWRQTVREVAAWIMASIGLPPKPAWGKPPASPFF
ncbi:putative Glycosyltransferase family 4 protein [uncultured Gammaproteobacteria bacterium]